MNEPKRTLSWLQGINQAATKQQIAFPPPTDFGMGTAVWRDESTGRAVSFKRRLVSLAQAQQDGIEWGLWHTLPDQTKVALSFREPLTPTPERLMAVFSIIREWLLEKRPIDQVKETVTRHATPRFETIAPLEGKRREYWLSDERSFGIVVEGERWSISSRGRNLSSWRFSDDSASGDHLPISILDSLCLWLARHWLVIAYGTDVRPVALQELRAAASRAYEDAQLMQQIDGHADATEWWNRHAIRAADGDLPNVFIERQGEQLVVSWDALPTSNKRFYNIPNDEEVLDIRFAVPVLRKLVRSRLTVMPLDDAERARLLAATADDASDGYSALAQYNKDKSLDRNWLNRHDFSDCDARAFALAGTSRHPVVGLLRTSQGSSISVQDYDMVLQGLEASTPSSYRRLLEVARGLDGSVDVREPWESGYLLAALVRQKLGKFDTEVFDVEAMVRELGIRVFDAPLADPAVLGACIGAPAYAPMILINTACPDASGFSGRRITLAHELCHLLFDRSHMLSLSRFEGRGADSDRLIEMRANAFAVELLVPMALLIKEAGEVLSDEELQSLSIDRRVSLTALKRHAGNLRNRLQRR